MSKGKMILNCDLLDARNIREENYSEYDQMVINCDSILTNKRAQEVMAKLPMILNCDSVIELPDDVDINLETQNGDFTISPSMNVKENTVLRINGNLILEPGAEDVSERYYSIIVDGNVFCPEGYGSLGNIKAEGKIVKYPQGKPLVILGDKFEVDKLFVLRSKPENAYFAEEEIYAAGPESNVKELAGKDIKFITNEIFVRESDVEAGIKLVDETTKITTIPDDMTFVVGNAELDERFMERTEGNAFVTGSLTIKKENVNLISKVRHIVVNGSVKVPRGIKEELAKANIECSDIFYKRDKEITGSPMAKIDQNLLDACPDGISVTGVGVLTIKDNVTPESILEKLDITGVGMVKCYEDQEASVAAISVGVGRITTNLLSEVGEGMGELFGAASPMDAIKGLLKSKVINADDYVL